MSYQPTQNPQPITPVSATGTANMSQEYNGNLDLVARLLTQILSALQAQNLLLASLAGQTVEVDGYSNVQQTQ
jgi:hypothetical protein